MNIEGMKSVKQAAIWVTLPVIPINNNKNVKSDNTVIKHDVPLRA